MMGVLRLFLQKSTYIAGHTACRYNFRRFTNSLKSTFTKVLPSLLLPHKSELTVRIHFYLPFDYSFQFFYAPFIPCDPELPGPV